MSRPGFMIYFQEWAALDSLNDAQFRTLFRAVFRYAQTGDDSTIDDPMVALAFQMLRHKLDDDVARYKSKCKKNQDNANKRWHEKDADAYERIQTDANDANININPNANSNISLNHSIPTVEEVETYARSIDLNVDVQEFYKTCEANGWCDNNGQPIRNWRIWLKGYANIHPKRDESIPEFLKHFY